MKRIDLPDRGIALEVLEARPERADPARRLLLVHGFQAAKEDFADHLDALAARGWHAIAPDLRGHGASDHPPGQDAYSFAILAEDLRALADALGWQEPFTVLGHSIGGAIVQHFALAHPERVHALVLMDTCHTAMDNVDPADVALGQQVVAEAGLAVLQQLQAERGVDPLGTAAHARVAAERPGYAEYGDRKLLACSPDMWCAIVGEVFSQPDRLDALASITAPTLVLVGEQDAPFLADSERMAKTIPGATLVVLPDAGHSPQFENPSAWWDALNRFLNSL